LIEKEQKQSLKLLSVNYLPQIEVVYTEKNSKEKLRASLVVSEFVDVMRIKARGKSLAMDNILGVRELEPIPYEEPEVEELELEN
jgi:topoisomerase-4 subunit A